MEKESAKLNNPFLSLVIPLFNEEEVFPMLLKELNSVCRSLGKGYEIIFVDDGSTDKTFVLIKEASSSDERVKALRFSRNFGHQAAFNAGIDFSSGEMVITMDGDLQHPPFLIPRFIKHAEEGYDIVIGERTENKHNSGPRELLGRVFYKFLSATTNLEFRNASDFALYKRPVISALKRLPERERFLRGLVQWVGFRKKYISYEVGRRGAGVPKYNFKRLAKLVISGITSFSAFPLRLAFWIGVLTLFISIGLGIYVVLDYFLNYDPMAAGFATLALLVLFLGGIQLLILGIVGEYLYKMFNEIKARPFYIVSDVLNIDEGLGSTPYGLNVLRPE
ncbi:MAG: glycosyltransferase family 2 protein [Candidatus Colwellbacteria bacterium]